MLGSGGLATEYTEADLSPVFRANGSTSPTDPKYVALAENGFADYRLRVGGLVERPMDFSLADLRARVFCVWVSDNLARIIELSQTPPD